LDERGPMSDGLGRPREEGTDVSREELGHYVRERGQTTGGIPFYRKKKLIEDKINNPEGKGRLKASTAREFIIWAKSDGIMRKGRTLRMGNVET